MSGVVPALYKAAVAGDPMIAVNEVHAIPGKGIEGDRYASKSGTWSYRSNDRDLSIIDTAYVEKLKIDYGITLEPGEHRRNIETTGINLHNLVGKEFYIGSVHILTTRILHPCQYLVDLTGKSLMKGLMDSGLYVQILSEGTIKIGDKILVKD